MNTHFKNYLTTLIKYHSVTHFAIINHLLQMYIGRQTAFTASLNNPNDGTQSTCLSSINYQKILSI